MLKSQPIPSPSDYTMTSCRSHTGEHPRMGALDVCPFIPVSNITMDECVQLSVQFAKQVLTLALVAHSHANMY